MGEDGIGEKSSERLKKSSVSVSLQSLISQEEFDRVQVLISQKVERNIRMRQKLGHFTYNGFVWCSKCGRQLHTFRNQFDRHYYVCSGKKHRDNLGETLCPYTGYMNRDQFEPLLHHLFSEQLTDQGFLRRVYEYQLQQVERQLFQSRALALQENIKRLESTKQRITDLFVDGEISREDHRLRLTQVDRDLRQWRELLAAQVPMPLMDAAGLA
jgi:Recombinase zinc beta ribbon domain